MEQAAIRQEVGKSEAKEKTILTEEERRLAYALFDQWYRQAWEEMEVRKQEKYNESFETALQDTALFFMENSDRLLYNSNGEKMENPVGYFKTVLSHKFASYKFDAGTRGKTSTAPKKYWERNLNKGFSFADPKQSKYSYALHRKMLSAIGEENRKLLPVYVLHFYHGISAKNCYKALQIPKRTFYKHVHRIKRILFDMPKSIEVETENGITTQTVRFLLDDIQEKAIMHNVGESSLTGYEDDSFFLKRVDSPSNGCKMQMKTDIDGLSPFSISFPCLHGNNVPLPAIEAKDILSPRKVNLGFSFLNSKPTAKRRWKTKDMRTVKVKTVHCPVCFSTLYGFQGMVCQNDDCNHLKVFGERYQRDDACQKTGFYYYHLENRNGYFKRSEKHTFKNDDSFHPVHVERIYAADIPETVFKWEMIEKEKKPIKETFEVKTGESYIGCPFGITISWYKKI